MVSHNRPILTITMALALVAAGAPIASAQRELTPRAATTTNPAAAAARPAHRDPSDQRSTAVGALGTPTAAAVAAVAAVAAATLVNREIGSTKSGRRTARPARSCPYGRGSRQPARACKTGV
jgi:hypothetical protein